MSRVKEHFVCVFFLKVLRQFETSISMAPQYLLRSYRFFLGVIILDLR